MERFVYADNAATTPVSKHVLDAMLPYLTENYGNPSNAGVYSFAQTAKDGLEKARAQVAAALGCEPAEIIFTACGTESDNYAIKGAARRLRAKGKNHIITTNFEHHAVLHTCKHLEKEGFEVTYLPVDKDGLVTAEDVRKAIRPETAIVSVMYANNEIGTIEPIAEIGAVCRAAGVWFHTDAVQAVGNVRINVKEQNIDMLSLSGHKLNAPKGVGALYVRKGIVLDTFMDGGAQENGRRAGTENVASIVGLGAAIEDIYAHFDEKVALQKKLRDMVIDCGLGLERTRLNGSREHRLPGNVNLSFEGIEGESLLLMLDMCGIEASSGSACTSGSLDPSHVLLAIGLSHEIAHGSLRITFGGQNTVEDAAYICEKLPPIVAEVRRRSCVWDDIKRKEKEGK
ncbi:MAG: cysteine desulfurase NifS [Oscillospiraceae bacterium]|nr:cysteine desulfurase NifS [Oscillospiraceae bacterium]